MQFRRKTGQWKQSPLFTSDQTSNANENDSRESN